MKKSRKGVALFLAMTMIISPMSALAKEGDASSGRVSGGLEDSGGIVNKGADFVENDKGDVVVQVSDNVWNNQNQKHAEFKDAEALFKRSEFTVLVDLKRTEPSASSDQDKRALLSIGTETNNLHVFTLSGKLGYGDTVKGGGISAHQVALSEKVGSDWTSAALVYEETEGGNGAVNVYLNGKKAASVDDIGFKMSEQTNIRAMLGRSFNTSFLMGGMFDHIVVKDTAMDEAAVKKEADERLAARGDEKLQEAYDALTLTTVCLQMQN